MYFTIVAFVLALAFPTYAFTDQAPAANHGCCQMQSDHAGHGESMACCAEKATDACKNCQDGKCADCCSNGECKDCCKDANCCKHEAQTADEQAAAGCCKKAAAKN